jgi:hypothetical protein
MDDLFIKATRRAYRWSSNRGDLTVEQLWDLPLSSRGGFDLDHVGRTLLAEIKAMGEESLVETRPNPAKADAEARLEVLKFIIATRQEEARAAELRATRADQRRKVLDALAARDADDLSKASREELLARLEELEG